MRKPKKPKGITGEAAIAYAAAKDYDAQVRLLLQKLKAPEEAVAVVRETKSTEGAKMIARFFEKLNDYGSAMQFLILSKCTEEAFQIARNNGQMELFAELLGTRRLTGGLSESRSSFRFREELLPQWEALKNLLKAAQNSSDDTNALQVAIDVVAEANDDKLTRQLIDFLMGEVDGIPKDAKFLFRLYMAKKQYKEAAKTAVIIAGEEQNAVAV
ncbi:WD repeat-containing protein 19 [Armadillidium vulgare]|nr:WD repeat-containing protein 19 [Armadillidium vulgare]